MERIFLKMVCVSASSSGLREENDHGKGSGDVSEQVKRRWTLETREGVGGELGSFILSSKKKE